LPGARRIARHFATDQRKKHHCADGSVVRMTYQNRRSRALTRRKGYRSGLPRCRSPGRRWRGRVRASMARPGGRTHESHFPVRTRKRSCGVPCRARPAARGRGGGARTRPGIPGQVAPGSLRPSRPWCTPRGLHGRLAQMDRASVSEAEGHWFESSSARQLA
jgi:hypothetical protein